MTKLINPPQKNTILKDDALLNEYKKTAKELFKKLTNEGLTVSLMQCQQKIAKNNGFDSWHTLRNSLKINLVHTSGNDIIISDQPQMNDCWRIGYSSNHQYVHITDKALLTHTLILGHNTLSCEYKMLEQAMLKGQGIIYIHNGEKFNTDHFLFLAKTTGRKKDILGLTIKNGDKAIFNSSMLSSSLFVELVLMFLKESNEKPTTEFGTIHHLLVLLDAIAKNNLETIRQLLNCSWSELKSTKHTNKTKIKKIMVQYASVILDNSNEHQRVINIIKKDLLSVIDLFDTNTNKNKNNFEHALKNNSVFFVELPTEKNVSNILIGKVVCLLFKTSIINLMAQKSTEEISGANRKKNIFALFSHTPPIHGFADGAAQMYNIGISACFSYSTMEQMRTLCGSNEEMQSIIANCNLKLFETDKKWQIIYKNEVAMAHSGMPWMKDFNEQID